VIKRWHLTLLRKKELCVGNYDAALQLINRAMKGSLPRNIKQKLHDMKDTANDMKADKKNGGGFGEFNDH
jgi:hypothetical protein